MSRMTVYGENGAEFEIDPARYGEDRLAADLKSGKLSEDPPSDTDEDVELSPAEILERFTVAELRALAQQNDVDLGDATTKAAIIEVIVDSDAELETAED